MSVALISTGPPLLMGNVAVAEYRWPLPKSVTDATIANAAAIIAMPVAFCMRRQRGPAPPVPGTSEFC